ncbi:hypothetical protein ACSBR1_015337 [Camellia fascicularis]
MECEGDYICGGWIFDQAVLIMNGQIREERQEKTGELLEGSQGASDSRMSQMLPDSEDVNQLVGDRLHGMSNGVTSLASLFRESMVKFYVFEISKPSSTSCSDYPCYDSSTNAAKHSHAPK